MRIMDVFLSIPQIIFVLLFVSLIGTKEWPIVLLIGIAHIPQVARITHGWPRTSSRGNLFSLQRFSVYRAGKFYYGKFCKNVYDLRIKIAAGHDIVADASFSIKAGEVMGLVGKSGSGKTTLGMAMLDFVRSGARMTKGAIFMAGDKKTI